MGVSVCDHTYVHGGGDFIFVTHIFLNITAQPPVAVSATGYSRLAKSVY